jgi:tRNA threonylcarbamoyladenosine biosynthesis protein TsaB
MHILAIDTALEACAAAVLDTGSGTMLASETIIMTRGHAEALVPLIARVMDSAGLEFAELDRIAVTVGPGSFTGLRTGISAARGIALAASKPAVGLTTLAAFAAPHVSASETTAIASAIDARNNSVYLQVFAPNGQTLAVPQIVPITEAVRLASEQPVRLVGSAAQLLADAWPAGTEAPVQVKPLGAPEIQWIARLGAAAKVRDMPPRPLYLRAPDARPQEGAKLARQ